MPSATHLRASLFLCSSKSNARGELTALEGRHISSQSPSRLRNGDDGIAERNGREKYFTDEGLLICPRSKSIFFAYLALLIFDCLFPPWQPTPNSFYTPLYHAAPFNNIFMIFQWHKKAPYQVDRQVHAYKNASSFPQLIYAEVTKLHTNNHERFGLSKNMRSDNFKGLKLFCYQKCFPTRLNQPWLFEKFVTKNVSLNCQVFTLINNKRYGGRDLKM